MLMKFYENNVKLSSADVKKLRELRKINENRLENGLKSLGYPCYEKVIEQGSISMNTAIKSLDDEYDIDLAVIFNSADLKVDISPELIKEYVFKSLTNNDIPFKKKPEVRTNAVTLWYESGYHVDFAVYKYDSKKIQHAGNEWTDRNPSNIDIWFANCVKKYNYLKEVIQLIKYIVKLDTNELKISGLMITVLVVEFFENSRLNFIKLEDCLIETVKYVHKRLLVSNKILNPDNNINLNNSEKDSIKISNLKNILNNIIFSIASIQNNNILFNKIFETNFFDYSTDLDVDIIGVNGYKKICLNKIICNVNDKIHFSLKTDLYFDKIRWEVVNTGYEAIIAKCLNHYTEDEHPNIKYLVVRDAAYRGVHRMICHLYLNNNLLEKIEKEITIS